LGGKWFWPEMARMDTGDPTFYKWSDQWLMPSDDIWCWYLKLIEIVDVDDQTDVRSNFSLAAPCSFRAPCMGSKSGPQQPRGAQSVLRFKPLKTVLRICPILVIILINQKLIIHYYEDNVSNKHVNCDILWCKKWPVQSDWLLLNQIPSQWLDGRLDGGNSPNQRT
jgi:hypothetical protein